MKLLDLFSGAGGAAVGYHRAGFEVTGVDIVHQPRYPFTFIQADALTFPLAGFDAIHASPPCQGYSRQANCRPGLKDRYPRLIEPVRDRLRESGLPYVIENVEGAPLENPRMLCGWMFGYPVYRHRLFETNFSWEPPFHREHVTPSSQSGHWRPGTFISVAGHCAPIALARDAMDIGWMTREELCESVPPYFTQNIGGFLREAVR